MKREGLLGMLTILVVAIVIVAGILYFFDISPADLEAWLKGNIAGEGNDAQIAGDTVQGTALPKEGMLTVAVLNCGNADSLFIQTAAGKTMLIDAGESDDFETIHGYLQAAGVERLDVLVATHPHNDHIGSMTKVVQHYDLGAVYMPRVSHNTKTYENLCTAILEKGLTAKAAKGGTVIDLGDDVKVTALAPNSDEYSDLNNYSVVIRLEYGDVSFLLAGDAEKASEKEMLKEYPEMLDCDVLKVPHHGSDSSSSEEFIDAVSPVYAAIPCDNENDYGHPAEEVTDRLTEHGVTYYRSDVNGTIAFYSDGKTVDVETEK